MRTWSTALAALVFGVLGEHAAYAQERTPSVDVRAFRPYLDPRSQLATEPATVPHHLDFNVVAIAHYAHGPVLLTRGDGAVAYRPLQNQLTLDIGANLALFKVMSVGLGVPVLLLQSGSDNLPPTVSTSGKVPTTAVGDLGLFVKGVFVNNDTGGLGVVGLSQVSFPTGTPGSFAREKGPTVSARALIDYSLLIAGVQASVGYTLRTSHVTWPDASVGGVTFGDSLPFSMGFWFRPSILKIDAENRQRWDLGLRGSLPVWPVGPFGLGDPGSAQLTQLALVASDRIELGKDRDVYLVAGAELGLTSGVGVPAFRATLGVGYSFQRHDRDDDGIPDDKDECPDVPEDKDGVEDQDGCPDIDDDEDGIVDTEDACPRQKGVRSKDRTQNGCPPRDSDGDGVPDDVDACPAQKGESSFDKLCNGCPITDRDGDGIEDADDACPDLATDTPGKGNGCPAGVAPGSKQVEMPPVTHECPMGQSLGPQGCFDPDPDGDAILGSEDQCPNEPETYNGIKDDDGCPDEGGRALVLARPSQKPPAFDLVDALRFEGQGPELQLARASLPPLRALAALLRTHPDWTVAVGVRPEGSSKEAAQVALAKSFAVAIQLSQWVPREGVAETVSWESVRSLPGAKKGVGLLLLQPATPSPSVGPMRGDSR